MKYIKKMNKPAVIYDSWKLLIKEKNVIKDITYLSIG